MAKQQIEVDKPQVKSEKDFKEEENDLEKYFMEDLFPLALTYGMTAQEFWYDDPSLMWSYRIFYEKKKQQEYEEQNTFAWLQGIYIYDGVSKAIANAFKGKGTKAYSYMDSPIDLSGKGEKKEKISEKSKKQFNYWAKLGERK